PEPKRHGMGFSALFRSRRSITYAMIPPKICAMHLGPMAAKSTSAGLVLSVALGVLAAGFAARAEEETAAAPSAPAARSAELRLLEFRPKLSPDTVLDYRPSLAERVAALPPAQLSQLGDLIAMLEGLKERAVARPGT